MPLLLSRNDSASGTRGSRRRQGSPMSFYAALVLFVALSWALVVTSYVNGAPKTGPWGRSWAVLRSPEAVRTRRPSTSCVETLLATRGGGDGEDKPEPGSKGSSADAYSVVKKETMYKGRFRSIVKKDVKFPDGRVFDFDILNAHCCGSVMVFAWDSATKTSTIVEEFAPGTEEMIIGPVAGGVEEKHGGGDGLMAGQFELEEEARLTGGTWYTLLAPDTTAPGDKYTSNRFYFFLVVDPTVLHQEDARARDHEEEIDIRSGVSMPELLDLLRQGRMTVPAGLATLLAKDKLQELGLL